MDYLKRSFRSPGNSKQFRDNWDSIFRKNPEPEEDTASVEYSSLFYNSYKEYLAEPRVRERHDEMFAMFREFYGRELEHFDVLDLGCGLGEFRSIPDEYYGVDKHGYNPGTNLVCDYNQRLPTIEDHELWFEPNAVYSGFSIERCNSKEDAYALYERIFNTYPSVKFIFTSGFYYTDRKDCEVVKEAGGIKSYQTLDCPEDVDSDLFTETRITMKAPSNMFGENVVEVWKVLKRK